MKRETLRLVEAGIEIEERAQAPGTEERPTDDVLPQIDAIIARCLNAPESCQAHKELFSLYTELHKRLSAAGEGISALQERASLVAAQSEILDASASLPARTVVDVTYKLALWRLDYHRSRDEVWPRGDIVAAAVLEDLIAITGETDARFVEDEHED
ncbi:hypothetical protein [Parvularcula lutaonensis]|uniref:Uncharacterized protein n=1 Tax=Parvularcula lutaonensis TaxID=491923 RepID=A0ABV7MF63_9PROT|nr:hypothetical protein [Parvularcula lutaonensis]GGY53575.1 hypothetical protein GCM10007148_23550 [Parvularcula lutaonensis]